MEPTEETVRTRTHAYPQSELDVLYQFYGPFVCAVTRGSSMMQWSHLLDAALLPCDERLAWMLARNLRQDRHPRHAAEVRENLIPLAPTEQYCFDAGSLYYPATIFLHEDILTRTLAYEQELQQWRLAELQAGRTDPGRPAYEDVFQVFGITEHRWHHATGGTTRCDTLRAYQPKDCPGVEPPSSNPFPIIKTLLSIPFSLLHTLPRLINQVPQSIYSRDLILMGEEIVRLWSWDPSAEDLQKSEAIRAAAGDVDQTRLPRPAPIDDASRKTNTFATMRPRTTFGDGLHLTEARSSLEGDSSCEHHEKESIGADDSTSAYAQSDLSSDSDGDDEISRPQDPHPPPDISAWLQSIVYKDSEETIPPFNHSPFRKGVIGGASVNDILMVRGQIDPVVYVDYLDLDLFAF